MKAVISDRIYLKGTPELIDSIKKKLTYRIETKISGRGGKTQLSVDIIRNYKQLPRDVLSIPRGRIDLVPVDYEIVDKRVLNFADFPEPRHSLREGQQVVYDEVDSDCFINALVGWGSPNLSLALLVSNY